MRTLADAAAMLAKGEATSRGLVEECLGRAADPSGEGARAFVRIERDSALRGAEFQDLARKAGCAPTPYAGIPVSIKDLFDVAGSVTRAASRVLEGDPPAEEDAPAVARLKAAGFVPVGRTNMTEFAYSGLGMNAHFGTPLNQWDRGTGRIPGGSTSGGVVSVTDGMAYAALGTDTGGSCRIPAALSGTAGFKPTSARVPRKGCVPLSPSLDSVGSLAPSVGCCALIDSLISGGAPAIPAARPLKGVRLGFLQTLVTDDVDPQVASAFSGALACVSRSGARVDEVAFGKLAEYPAINSKGGLVAAEAYAYHRRYLGERSGLYDPWVLNRFDAGKSQTAADHIDLLEARRNLRAEAGSRFQGYDALVMPTVPIVAPKLEDMAVPEASGAANRLLLRNPSVWNFLDRPAVSLPCHPPGGAPVGLMLVGHPNADRRLLSVARAVEEALAGAAPGRGKRQSDRGGRQNGGA